METGFSCSSTKLRAINLYSIFAGGQWRCDRMYPTRINMTPTKSKANRAKFIVSIKNKRAHFFSPHIKARPRNEHSAVAPSCAVFVPLSSKISEKWRKRVSNPCKRNVHVDGRTKLSSLRNTSVHEHVRRRWTLWRWTECRDASLHFQRAPKMLGGHGIRSRSRPGNAKFIAK